MYVGHTTSLQRCIAHAALAISHPYVRSGEITKSRQRNTTTCTNIMKQKELIDTDQKKCKTTKKQIQNKSHKQTTNKYIGKKTKKTKKNNQTTTKQQAVTVARPGDLRGHRGRKASHARLASVLSRTEVIITIG